MLNTPIKTDMRHPQAGAEGTLGAYRLFQLGNAGTGGISKNQVKISAAGKTHRDQALGTHNLLGQQCPAEGTARHRALVRLSAKSSQEQTPRLG